MNETFSHYITSWQFWFASVVIGIGINIVSHLLIARLGSIGARFSKTIANINNASKIKRQNHVKLLVMFPDMIQAMTASVTREKINQLIFLVITTLLTFITMTSCIICYLELLLHSPENVQSLKTLGNVSFAGCIIFIFLSLDCGYRAARLLSIIYEAESILDKKRETPSA